MAVQLWARFPGGTVAETWPHDPAAKLPEGVATPVDAFGAEFGKQFAPCSADVCQGWTTADGGQTFTAPAAIVPPPVVRTVPGTTLVHLLDKATKVCPRDLAYVAGLAAAREDMASIQRIAAVDGRTAEAWFDLALSPPA